MERLLLLFVKNKVVNFFYLFFLFISPQEYGNYGSPADYLLVYTPQCLMLHWSDCEKWCISEIWKSDTDCPKGWKWAGSAEAVSPKLFIVFTFS